MKKLHVQIHQHRFELESRGEADNAVIEQTAAALTEKIELLRQKRGFPDSARATALAALLLVMEMRQGTTPTSENSAQHALLQSINDKINNTLEQTSAVSTAKALRNSLDQ